MIGTSIGANQLTEPHYYGSITGDDLSANYEAINRAYNLDAMKLYNFADQNSNAAGSFAAEQGGLNISFMA